MTFVQLKLFLKNPIGIFSRGKKSPAGKNSHLAKWEKIPMGKISHGKK